MSGIVHLLFPWHSEEALGAQDHRAERNRIRTIETKRNIEIVARRAEAVARAYADASEVIPLL